MDGKTREPYKQFYNTTAWKRCREAYKRSVGGLCERCLKDGVITAGKVVHHKIYLTAELANDPNVALNFDNLELLCWKHHEEEHKGIRKRYEVDENGRVKSLPYAY